VFDISRSQVRRDLAGGGFYIATESGWEKLGAAADDVLEADGVPAIAKLKHGKRDVRIVELAS
jgi:hypothetical protein